MSLADLHADLARLNAELTALARTHGSTMAELMEVSRKMTPLERAIRVAERER